MHPEHSCWFFQYRYWWPARLACFEPVETNRLHQTTARNIPVPAQVLRCCSGKRRPTWNLKWIGCEKEVIPSCFEQYWPIVLDCCTPIAQPFASPFFSFVPDRKANSFQPNYLQWILRTAPFWLVCASVLVALSYAKRLQPNRCVWKDGAESSASAEMHVVRAPFAHKTGVFGAARYSLALWASH